ncbi:Leucine Rich repeat [Carpediemonas membranifera]|uniref:Leucine Rich repeat n=1 Tax=Carpediemonas membranifera TaxID=201153 RepID=A0A8J6E010_9EUKA|nr:Leucine Rich repeat [Carpediemonas membranifera]|eukprot:KAG9391493.1 Leucine Rich repeat [Carpediemonas membranifera]
MASNGLFKEVYLAMCKDTGEIPTNDGLSHFVSIAEASPPGQVVFPKCRLGPSAIITLLKRYEGTQLTIVNLFGNLIRSVGFSALLQTMKICQSVETVDVGNNDIGPDAIFPLAEDLKYDNVLKKLELGYTVRFYHPNCIGPDAAAALANGVTSNRTLQHLGLNGNMIGDGSKLACTAIGEMLRVNRSVTTLMLSDNCIEPSGLVPIAEGLRTNTSIQTLHLSGNGLNSLCLANNLGPAVQNSVLTTLNLSRNDLGGGHFPLFVSYLKDHETIQNLSLRSCELHDEGVVPLCEALATCRKIRAVDLSNNGITPASTSALCEDLLLSPSLVELKLNKNPLTSSVIERIASVLPRTELAVLELSTCRFGGPGSVELVKAACGRLEGQAWTEVSTGTVTSLRLNDNHIDEESGNMIAQTIQQCSSIVSVDITGNQVSHGTIKLIKQACLRNKHSTKDNRPQKLKLELARLHSSQKTLESVQQELMVEQQASARANQYVEVVTTEIDVMKIKYAEKKVTLKGQIETIEQEAENLAAKVADRRVVLKQTHEGTEAQLREAEATAAATKAQLEEEEHNLDLEERMEAEYKEKHAAFLAKSAETLKLRGSEMEEMEKEINRLEAELDRLPPEEKKQQDPAVPTLDMGKTSEGRGKALKSARKAKTTARKTKTPRKTSHKSTPAARATS